MTAENEDRLSRLGKALARAEAAAVILEDRHRHLRRETTAALVEMDALIGQMGAKVPAPAAKASADV